MNLTDPYWTPPTEYRPKKSLWDFTRDLGFRWTLPWPLPVSAGWYHGQGPRAGRREHVFRADPEWFAYDNIIPSTAGTPMVNPFSDEMKFRRSDYTIDTISELKRGGKRT